MREFTLGMNHFADDRSDTIENDLSSEIPSGPQDVSDLGNNRKWSGAQLTGRPVTPSLARLSQEDSICMSGYLRLLSPRSDAAFTLPESITPGRSTRTMVLVQVELESPEQVQDLTSFLLMRSYYNFRVTDHESLASGSTPSKFSADLLRSSNRSLCRSPLAEDTDCAQGTVRLFELRDEKPPVDGPDELDLFEQKPTEQELRACLALPDAGSLLDCEATESAAEDDISENDVSLDVPMESQDVPDIENKREGSSKVRDGFFRDPFLVERDRVQCALCNKDMVTHAGIMSDHINRKHTKFHLYGCSVCPYSTLSRANIVRHVRFHNRVAHCASAHVIKFP
ncbi:hypothetical protein KIN20_022551 [Parelaphostrongylus tenuis]|uniref:C2H2-type domain-containing protein n=1 Tax=Parelaphostrongylus tenuis TaxID=148309 RepID=A0AAD5N840_PARTN|nr:hypothetical protein KIN20_022551 [Parelaphostrongylus tenuis]